MGIIGQQPAGLLDEQAELSVIAGRTDMANDAASAVYGFGVLDRSGA
ncbi:hypothetical protein [Mycobacterium sp. GA-1841]|nr:hypothetical protein [Mycobacterium sp. GA-1841]